MIPLKQFAIAGNATFTVSNTASGNRFTFRVKKSKKKGAEHLRFVSVLTGCDNENHYEFLGTIFRAGELYEEFKHGRRSRIKSDAPCAKCFSFIWKNINSLNNWPTIEVRHSGKCCRCGRKLTVPESIDSGIGPECAGRI